MEVIAMENNDSKEIIRKMEVMDMENNNLKEIIRKNIKEKIAISKIRKELNMKRQRNKKIIYWITSSAAVFVLGFGIIRINTFNNLDIQNSNYEIGDLRTEKENNEKNLKVDLQINKIEQLAGKRINGQTESVLDAKAENIDLETINIEKLPEQFKIINNINIPQGFNLNDMYKVYIRSNIEINKYDLLHDYVISYIKDNEHDIRISSSMIGEPLRDYGVGDNSKISKIGDVELKIYQYEEMYMAIFKVENIYFDIETNGLTENELLELLKSIINEIEIINNTNINNEDKDTNVNQQPDENAKYPDFYAGKYADNNGNNVILLCENNETNRKAICSILGISEKETTFETAKYSYNYLTKLQNEISQKMIDKEFTFVTSSAVMEDSNNIKVTVSSNNKSDLNKIKALDTIGGAIDIELNKNTMPRQDLLIEKE